MNYRDLVSQIAEEIGGSVPPSLPSLIREVEKELWGLFYFLGDLSSETLTIPADQEEITISDELWLAISSVNAVYTAGNRELYRVSLPRFSRLKNSVGILDIYCWEKDGKMRVARAPSEDTDLEVVVWKAQSPLEDGDDGSSKFFLGRGFNLLKYAVLYKRFFDPERYQYWKSQYTEALESLYREVGRRRYSYNLGGLRDDPTGSY